MFPGMNPKKMQQMMKKMGMQQQDIPATEVIIKSADKEIVITDPKVSKINMMGQETFQVVGTIHERGRTSEKIEISEDDIKTVAEQAGVSLDDAKTAIESANGDLAEAILNLTT
ncbi:nascent polypeptide-associated complex protein [Candidatus Woesearchaeota archaeon]|nr:nascent polypeptide-associated complex protein [Candidatus Woesearchaeota archaeon]